MTVIDSQAELRFVRHTLMNNYLQTHTKLKKKKKKNTNEVQFISFELFIA